MIAIEVRSDPADWRIIKAVGRADIYLDGALKYKGRPKTGFNSEGEIIDLDDRPVLRSSLTGSRWKAFLENPTYIIQTAAGAELAQIKYRGFAGWKCAIAIGGQAFSCPQTGGVVLPGAAFRVSETPLEVRATVSDNEHFLAYLGIAFCLWMKRGVDDAYSSGG